MSHPFMQVAYMQQLVSERVYIRLIPCLKVEKLNNFQVLGRFWNETTKASFLSERE